MNRLIFFVVSFSCVIWLFDSNSTPVGDMSFLLIQLHGAVINGNLPLRVG